MEFDSRILSRPPPLMASIALPTMLAKTPRNSPGVDSTSADGHEISRCTCTPAATIRVSKSRSTESSTSDTCVARACAGSR